MLVSTHPRLVTKFRNIKDNSSNQRSVSDSTLKERKYCFCLLQFPFQVYKLADGKIYHNNSMQVMRRIGHMGTTCHHYMSRIYRYTDWIMTFVHILFEYIYTHTWSSHSTSDPKIIISKHSPSKAPLLNQADYVTL